MTRMIERWFPCQEVSEASSSGWGLGRAEKAVFTWFAARPPAQGKAAVITSLLPWPDVESEQQRLKALVIDSLSGRYACSKELAAEITKANPEGGSILDPFSGRGIIPLAAARLGLPASALDYSPVAVLASHLLIDFPYRDWSREPTLPYESPATSSPHLAGSARLLDDIETVISEVGGRHAEAMTDFYPTLDGNAPWGYLWAVTLPCQECGRRFPLVGSYALRNPSNMSRKRKASSDPGQSFFIDVDLSSGTFHAVVHDGQPRHTPTFANPIGAGGKKVKGKSAICPFCGRVHGLALHQRLACERLGEDVLLVVADIDPSGGKVYRSPTQAELVAAAAAKTALKSEPPFDPLLPAVPNEQIPLNNGATIRPELYGASSYGDLMCDRQTLSFVRLSRIISDVGVELAQNGNSTEYARALTGYLASILVRKLRYSTRGARLYVQNQQVDHIFVNESTVAFSYDFFEAGIGDGAGTWQSLADMSRSTFRTVLAGDEGLAATVDRGTATHLPYRDATCSAVVMDPPYDSMVYYTDSSDIFYVWLKRALHSTYPEMTFTLDPRGIQEKSDEIIVKEHGHAPGEHRNREHYDRLIAESFAEACRVVKADGVVTIVFGHGEPEVWHRLLAAISKAELVLTGSWPAKTESGGQQGKANIVTTLTMSCRPAPPNRQPGRANLVEAEVRQVVKERVPAWEAAGLAPTDQLMASAGPAMEVVGRYESVLNNLGEPVEPERYLVIARRAVEEAAAIEIDHLPLETFDPRTRFALSWARLYGREVAAKSEARWQALATDLDMDQLRGILTEDGKGYRLAFAREGEERIDEMSEVVDVALAMARAWLNGLDAVGEVMAASGRGTDDPYLWAAIGVLSTWLPEADPDAVAWTGLVRSKAAVSSAVRQVVVAAAKAEAQQKQRTLFDSMDAKEGGAEV